MTCRRRIRTDVRAATENTSKLASRKESSVIPTKSHALCVSLTHLSLFSRSHAWKQSISRMDLGSNQSTHYHAGGSDTADSGVRDFEITWFRMWFQNFKLDFVISAMQKKTVLYPEVNPQNGWRTAKPKNSNVLKQYINLACNWRKHRCHYVALFSLKGFSANAALVNLLYYVHDEVIIHKKL